MNIKKNKLGMLVALISAVCFGLSNTLAGIAYVGGSNPSTLSATRFLLPAIIIFCLLHIQSSPVLLPRKSGWIAIMLGIVTILYSLALLSAIELLPIPIAILIFYLFPIITGGILAVTGWAKYTLRNVIGSIIAFGGLALALGVSEINLDIVGIALAVSAAVGLAIVSAVSGRLIKDGDPRQATLYMAATAVVFMGVLITLNGDLNLPDTQYGWVGFILSNCFYAAAMIGFFYAISMTGPIATTFFLNMEPLVVTGSAFLFLGQTLLPAQLLGVLIVVGAIILFGQLQNK